jgi:hypothetical protein
VLGAEHLAGVGEDASARLPRGARPDEERELQGGLARHGAHLQDLGVREEHDPRPLRDAVDPDFPPVRLLYDRLQNPRSLDARDLHPVLRAVRETLPRVG